MLTSAAADAARAAATYGTAPEVATATVAAIVGGRAGGRHRGPAVVLARRWTGLLVTVRCTMEAPGIIGLLDGVMPDIEVTGHSAKETIS